MEAIKKLGLQGVSISILALALAACGGDSDNSAQSGNPQSTIQMTVTSDFIDGGIIPPEHTKLKFHPNALSLSVPLSWSNPPKDTAKYSIFYELQPDLPTNNPEAIIIYSANYVPASVMALTSGQDASKISGVFTYTNQGKNRPYEGFINPRKVAISVYALNSKMPIESVTFQTVKDFEIKYKDYILGSAKIFGTPNICFSNC